MAKANQNHDLDALIQIEMRALADEYIGETWREVSIEDLDTKMVAQVFIEHCLKHIAKELGEHQASEVLADINKLEKVGFLAEDRTLQ